MKVFQKWLQCLLNKEDSDWKEQLNRYEVSKDWACAIKLMKKVIRKNPNDIDAYLFMCYLLINILAEENYDVKKRDWYAQLLKKYYYDSYAKFNQNPEYLFYIGKMACMAEWYFDSDMESLQSMMKKAAYLDPNNPLYQWAHFMDFGIDIKETSNYAKRAVSDPIVISMLKKKGALGSYILGLLYFWVNEK